jgi:hypothetical protein
MPSLTHPITQNPDILLQGDCLSHLATLKADSVDLICTDPPYGIGFQGKAWDSFATAPPHAHRARRKPMGRGTSSAVIGDTPSGGRSAFQSFMLATAKACLRVLKPGAFMFVTMTPRQDSLARVITALEEAGFAMGFTSLYWSYASGFPKALNVGKAIDRRRGAKRKITGRRRQNDMRGGNHGSAGRTFLEPIRGGAVSPQARALDGAYGGFQPKPAVEVIIVAMKPLRRLDGELLLRQSEPSDQLRLRRHLYGHGHEDRGLRCHRRDHLQIGRRHLHLWCGRTGPARGDLDCGHGEWRCQSQLHL